MEKKDNIITLIKEKPVSHSIKTIQDWKTAIKLFEKIENPNRTKLYELYDDILLDGQLEAVWGKRRDSILNKRLTFVKEGEKNEEINSVLNSPDMRNLLEDILNTIGYGYTLIQINDIYYDKEQEYYHINYDLIPRQHVHPELNFQCVSIDSNKASKDILFKEQPLSNYMIWTGKNKDKGLFLKVAPYIIYKRGAMGDWSQFAEMFGMPFREALYDAFDNDTREKIDEMLQDWGPGMSFVHPKSVEIKLHDTGGSTSSSEVYDRFIQVCDAAIAKTIVGNTLTTEHGTSGNRALGEVHQSEEDEKKLSDELFVLSVLNTQFRSILKRFGFKVDGGKIWYETPDKDWAALLQKWSVINGIADKVPISDDYIYEEFDIPKPEDYDNLKEEMKLEKMASLMPYGYTNVQDNIEITPTKSSNKTLKNIWNFFVKGSQELPK